MQKKLVIHLLSYSIYPWFYILKVQRYYSQDFQNEITKNDKY